MYKSLVFSIILFTFLGLSYQGCSGETNTACYGSATDDDSCCFIDGSIGKECLKKSKLEGELDESIKTAAKGLGLNGKVTIECQNKKGDKSSVNCDIEKGTCDDMFGLKVNSLLLFGILFFVF